MSNKFPEIDVPQSNGDDLDHSDFLSREKELLGDEFKTDQDKVLEEDSDDEFNEFKEQFPEVEGSESVQQEFKSTEEVDDEDADVALADYGATETVKDLSQEEKVNEQKKKDILSKAQQTIDDFYENYNSKKEKHIAEVEKEQEAFLKKRDEFLKHGTLWDRVNELIDAVGVPTVDSEGNDKTRYRNFLKNLKGKEKVPGAGGYQE
ncbi:unnamed protein product [Candida parapsilosis]